MTRTATCWTFQNQGGNMLDTRTVCPVKTQTLSCLTHIHTHTHTHLKSIPLLNKTMLLFLFLFLSPQPYQGPRRLYHWPGYRIRDNRWRRTNGFCVHQCRSAQHPRRERHFRGQNRPNVHGCHRCRRPRISIHHDINHQQVGRGHGNGGSVVRGVCLPKLRRFFQSGLHDPECGDRFRRPTHNWFAEHAGKSLRGRQS